MDLLSQYKQQYPEAFREQKRQPLTDKYGREYTGMVALVMRLSGGRIRDMKQASYTLVGFVVLVIIVSVILIFWNGESSPIHSVTTSDVLPR